LLEATPVGHSGARVDVHERPAWAISGWAGVVVVAAGMAIAVLIAGSTWIIRIRNFETNHLKVNDAGRPSRRPG
jgi:hypothetical protein